LLAVGCVGKLAAMTMSLPAGHYTTYALHHADSGGGVRGPRRRGTPRDERCRAFRAGEENTARRLSSSSWGRGYGLCVVVVVNTWISDPDRGRRHINGQEQPAAQRAFSTIRL
jgi:hypothetical protein